MKELTLETQTESDLQNEDDTKPQDKTPVHQIEFTVFAPYNSAARLIGDFCHWEDIEMVKCEDGYFRTTVELPDGDFEYKYKVISNSYWQPGEWATVTDPRATDVHKTNGENAILHVRNGKVVVDEYQWQHDDSFLPPDNELVIYEMHVGDFGGNFQGVIQKLDYLSGLGVNTIELMPLSEFPGENGWGYNPKYLYAVESGYGTSADLKQLIDTCHERGIRVMLDFVANHSHVDGPLAQIDHNYWFAENNTDDQQFGPKFDYLHWDDNLKLFPARRFVQEAVLYWTTQFHFDGVRFDATSLINNYEFLGEVAAELKEKIGPKPFYLIAEHIPVDPTIAGQDGPMDALWNDHFFFQMTANLREREFYGWQPWDWEKTMDAIQPERMGILGVTGPIQYLSNHDHERLMYELASAEILEDKAFRKARLGAAVKLTSVGVPMIWMGEEFGEFSDKSMDPRPLHWELLESEPNAQLYHFYSGLIYLRKTNGALKSPNLEFFHTDPEAKVLAWKRWDEEGNTLVVVANFSDEELPGYNVPNFPGDGEWHEFTFNYDHQVEGGVLVDNLAASECKVYLKHN